MVQREIAKKEREYNEFILSPDKNVKFNESMKLMKLEYEQKINDGKVEISQLRKVYNKQIKRKEDQISSLKDEMAAIESSSISLKSKLNNIIKEQKSYFLNILQIGYDVRAFGLVWVVKRLIELNCLLEYSMFPKFLDNFQIDYIITLAYKQIELSQLKVILKVLKERQWSQVKYNDKNDYMYNTTKSTLLSTNYSYFTSTPTNGNIEASSGNKYFNCYSSRTLGLYEGLVNKYEDLIKENNQQIIEDIYVHLIILTPGF